MKLKMWDANETACPNVTMLHSDFSLKQNREIYLLLSKLSTYSPINKPKLI